VLQDNGWSMREAILRRDAQTKLVDRLLVHDWTASIERVERAGEYAVVVAERNGMTRRAALLYSTGTDNGVFHRLEREVDLTLYNGEEYRLNEYAQGVTRPVISVDDFPLQLIEWNKASVPGKLVPVHAEAEAATPKVPGPRTRQLLSETPIDAIWSRLSRLRSATLARRAVADRAAAESVETAAVAINSKGDGVAYAIRNATDYFALKDVGNVSQRILNLYYGCLAFAFAEMLADPRGPVELSRIEDFTKQGHGLWTFDGVDEDFGSLAVGPMQSGFFGVWTKSMGIAPLTVMNGKPRKAADLVTAPAASWATMEQLFARVPEVGDLFEDVFAGPPAWVWPAGDMSANGMLGMFGSGARPQTSYVLFTDTTGRMSVTDIASLPGPIREISEVPSDTRGRRFRAAVDHPGFDNAWGVLKVHSSPFQHGSMILPVFGQVDEYRAVCVTILYALSILVRYRPSLWRRIQEGDLDHMRAMIEGFLSAVERILPQQFLESVTGERIAIRQPGSLF
jgi:hypothetical protein